MSATAAIAATIQKSGRQPPEFACSPPIVGPSATAPKMHRFMITAVMRSLLAGYPIASGGTAAISSRLVHSPWSTRPAMYMPELWAEAASTDPVRSSAA